MSMRALVWPGSLALLMQAWVARPLLEPPFMVPAGPAAAVVPVQFVCVVDAPVAATEVIAELRIGDWSISLRRGTPAAAAQPIPRPRMT